MKWTIKILNIERRSHIYIGEEKIDERQGEDIRRIPGGRGGADRQDKITGAKEEILAWYFRRNLV